MRRDAAAAAPPPPAARLLPAAVGGAPHIEGRERRDRDEGSADSRRGCRIKPVVAASQCQNKLVNRLASGQRVGPAAVLLPLAVQTYLSVDQLPASSLLLLAAVTCGVPSEQYLPILPVVVRQTYEWWIDLWHESTYRDEGCSQAVQRAGFTFHSRMLVLCKTHTSRPSTPQPNAVWTLRV